MNVKEYNEAVDCYADSIYRFALKHLKNAMNAQDIVQETFMKVWDKHQEVDAQKVKSYLFTTAYHTIINWIKNEKKSGDIEKAPIHQFFYKPAEMDIKEVLEKALDTLPEIQKTLVLLRDYEGYSYDEIGEICSLNPSQVKVYIFRARQQLKNYIKDKDLVA
ncbi:MAG: RNA polymerase sigma factor [Flavobacteriia bacterium]|nr:RNA polymerase sigma factor [Flavobacteriia bacterium]